MYFSLGIDFSSKLLKSPEKKFSNLNSPPIIEVRKFWATFAATGRKVLCSFFRRGANFGVEFFPEPKPDQKMFAQRNLRLRIAPEEYCPAWPDDEEEDNPLPGWVEGDSLAPYVGSDPSMLSEALTYAWLTPLDVVCDVGCGDGRFVTTAVQKLGAERGYGLDIDAE